MNRVQNLGPDEFLLWWFERASEHGLAEDYRLFYRNYFDRPDAIPYVWRHFVRRMRHLAELDLKGKSFLDVGCGLGTEVLWVALRGGHAVGLDLHPPILAIANKRLEIMSSMVPVRCEIRKQNLLDLSGQFDVIFMRETFHHLEPRDTIVEKLASLLSPGGKVIIEETNGYNPVIQFKYFWVRGFRTVVTKRWPDGTSYPFGNERITTGPNLTRLFTPHGIQGEATYFRLLPTVLARLPTIAAAADVVERFLPKWKIFRPFYLHYSWVGEKSY